jgi:predicted helicase
MQKIESIKHYLAAVEQALKAGNATEHTHRAALESLLERIGGDGIDAINEPKQIACGAPDFIVTRGVVPLGYVEAKDVGADLKKIERSEQLQRYLGSLGNLVLTDYFEFRWYLDSELRLVASLPRPGKDGRVRWNENAASEVTQLLGQFIAADLPLKSTPQDLATRMAKLAQLIRNLIEQTFKAEGAEGDLHDQLEAFRKVLIESLTPAQFADMYAQTLCYGLFAARCNAPGDGFTRQRAASLLPKTNPFLRKLFNTIAGPDLDDRIAWAVDQLAELLARADMAAILEDFGKRTRQEDPVVHFYETFLAAYDPKMREARGVYYTPEPVVGYIVRSVDALLKKTFKLRDGLADSTKVRWKTLKVDTTHGKTRSSTRIVESQPWVHKVQILDPAVGTGTFLYAVIQKIREHFDGNAGAWPGYVAEHLLPRLFGFELLMAPYAVAHMKLGLELEQTGYDFASNQRLGVYLTNTLEEAHEITKLPGFTSWLSEEANAAAEVKKDAPVMVVLGNPPYSGHSANTGQWISDLLRGRDSLNNRKTENYFEVDGGPLGERNPKWLNDDYVKFIRFAQWRIEQTGHGVLGFVTNHGYLDNPTFRGMRESLLRGFDEIYVLDLHGNSKKKEKAPDGGKDENVFDIQQGVAIGVFVRHADVERDDAHLAQIFHADLYGLRKKKYAALETSDIYSTSWRSLQPESPNYYFVRIDNTYKSEYETAWSVKDIFILNSIGIITKRDRLCIQWSPEDAWKAASDVASMSEIELREKYDLPDDVRDWKVSWAKQDVKNSGPDKGLVVPVHYRPFDRRYTYFTGRSRGFLGWPFTATMRHLIQGDNIALVTSRLTKGENFAHAQVSKDVTEVICMSSKTSNNGFVFPLWLYPAEEPADLLDTVSREKRPNLAPEFLAALTEAVGHSPVPEDVLAYIYAVLYAPSYRARYADFLKRDFPRVPLTHNRPLFARLVEIGRELVALHTLDSVLPRITTFDVAGSNEVEKVRYAPPEADAGGRVYINAAQYFGGLPQAVWDMHIGGYRVAEKWLKDRKGRLLSYDDMTHYQSVIAALARTLELQSALDAAIEDAGGWPLR